MPTVESVLRAAVSERGDHAVLVLGPAFQGLPDTAHGGSVLAALDGVAAHDGEPRAVSALFRHRVPLGVPLRLEVDRRDGRAICRVLARSSAVLVEGRVAGAPAPVVPALSAGGGLEPLPISTSLPPSAWM